MHQHPRPPPASASPANSERTNPTRTNNPRDTGGLYSEGGARPVQPPVSSESLDTAQQEPSASAMSRLNQVIQNFHTKAALIILHSRVELSPAFTKGTNSKRVNKWFNVELDETEEYKEEIRPWKTCDATDHRPPPLIIEIYLDTSALTNNQSLVIIDEQGKRWDVMEALTSSFSTRSGRRRSLEKEEVILERWAIELGDDRPASAPDLNVILPLVYKKSIVLFRSLFTYSKFLPAWKLSRRMAKLGSNGQLKLKYRILDSVPSSNLSRSDSLTVPLCESPDRVVDEFSFGVTDSPAGPFSVKVTYRNNCEFRVDDSEALLSSRFMGADDEFFKPSLPKDDTVRPNLPEVGSLPLNRKDIQHPDRSQAYGSLSTFHQLGPATGSSPLSALRNVQSPGSDNTPPRPGPSQRSSISSRSSFRTEGVSGTARRSSVSFQPFKGPTLSASPAPSLGTSPRLATNRVSALSALSEARGIQPNQIPSAASVARKPSEQAIASSTSSSPKPAPITRYSSSFSHRRARLSTGGPPKAEEDQNSSGRTSAASSAQPGSGLMAEAVTGSSESVHKDDENISDFLKLLDTEKDLLSPTSPASREMSTRRTSAALSRFSRMRDTNAVLSESLSSSLMLQRSSSSSSRQLSSVPPMVAATSVSTSSSPGKPISPHTPHTPAIPSRLSANSIIDYSQPDPTNLRHHAINEAHETRSDAEASEDTTVETITGNVGAIDIPTSPRPFSAAYRRSSSLAQRRAANVEDDMGDLYGQRSASLGDRLPPTASALVQQQEDESPDDDVLRREGRPSSDLQVDSPRRLLTNDRQSSLDYRKYGPQITTAGDGSNSASGSASAGSSTHQVYRSHITRGARRGHTAQGSTSSLATGGIERPESAGSETWSRRGGRASFSRPESRFEEDEPFLFAMSDIGGVAGPSNGSRRSIEEGRGESKRGSGIGRRGGPGSGNGGNYGPWS